MLSILSLSQIRNDLQKGLQQYEEATSQTLLNHEQRVNNLRVDLNLLEEHMIYRCRMHLFLTR